MRKHMIMRPLSPGREASKLEMHMIMRSLMRVRETGKMTGKGQAQVRSHVHIRRQALNMSTAEEIRT